MITLVERFRCPGCGLAVETAVDYPAVVREIVVNIDALRLCGPCDRKSLRPVPPA